MKLSIGIRLNAIRLSIGVKVLAAFVLLFVGIGALGGVAIDRMAALNDEARDLREHFLPAVEVLGKLVSAVMEYRDTAAHYLIAETPQMRAEAAQRLPKAAADVVEQRRAFQPLVAVGSPEEMLMRGFDQAWAALLPSTQEELAAHARGDDATAQSLYFGRNRVIYNTLIPLATNAVTYVTEGADAASRRGEAVYRTTRWVVLGAIAGLALLCAAIGFLIVATVARPVGRMTAAMQRLAAHDYAVQIDGGSRGDEIGAMVTSVEVFRASLIEGERLAREQREERERAGDRTARGTGPHGRHDRGRNHGGAARVSRAQRCHGDDRRRNARQRRTHRRRRRERRGAAACRRWPTPQTVASAAEQLTSSIHEISGQVAQSTVVVGRAVEAGQPDPRGPSRR